MILNVLDYPSPDVAIAAAVDGDTVYFPCLRTYSPLTASGWTINKSISLVGDGPGGIGSGRGQQAGTTLAPLGDANPLITIIPPVRQVHIRGFQLLGTGAASGTGSGIVCESTAGNPNEAADITLQNLTIRNFPGDAIRFATLSGSAPRIARVSITDSRIENCRGLGLSLTSVLNAMVTGVKLQGNRLGGCTATASSVALYECALDGNGIDAAGSLDAALKLDQCLMGRVDGCRFLNIDTGGSKRAICVNKGVAIISASYFAAAASAGTQGILLTGTGGGPHAIMSQRFKQIATLVKADSGTANVMLFAQYDESSTGSLNLAAGVRVFGAAHIIRPSGSLLTGMTVPSYAAEPTDNVRAGMMIYNTTTGKLRLRTATQWKTVSTS